MYHDAEEVLRYKPYNFRMVTKEIPVMLEFPEARPIRNPEFPFHIPEDYRLYRFQVYRKDGQRFVTIDMPRPRGLKPPTLVEVLHRLFSNLTTLRTDRITWRNWVNSEFCHEEIVKIQTILGIEND